MSNFIHLTNKTEYSLSEGALPISRLAELCNVNSMPAVGITDTNNMFGALEFSEQVSSAGVQPIIGCNIKIKTPKELLHENINNGDEYFFLNIFAKSLKGYENLLSIISNSYINFKEHAYINFNEFLKNNEDIIVLSGANNSILSHSNNGNITNQSKQLIETLKSSFTNNFYLEIQRIGKEFENVDENTILTLACDHYLPLVATNNVYYEGPDHYEAHDALMCIEKKLYVSQKDRKKLSREHYFKTHDEMNELFSDLPEAINNTLEIASRCSFRPCIKAPILPNYSNNSEDEKEMLIKLSNEGLGERLKLKFDRDKTSSEQEEDEDIHVSGHPCIEEMKDMYRNIKPHISVPVHGEHRHLKQHSFLAKELGVKFPMLITNGDILQLAPGSPYIYDQCKTGRLFLDGKNLVSSDSYHIRDRKRMSYNGILHITCLLDKKMQLKDNPIVYSCGIVDEENGEDYTNYLLEEEIYKFFEDQRNIFKKEKKVHKSLESFSKNFIYKLTGKKPLTNISIIHI